MPKKQTLRWRCVCRTCVREFSWDDHPWKKGDNGRLGRGKVSCTTVSDRPVDPAGSTGAEMTSELTRSEV